MLKVNTFECHLILCARCHHTKQKVIPTYSFFIDLQGILNKLQNCVQPHNVAYDLNHWIHDEVKQATPDQPVRALMCTKRRRDNSINTHHHVLKPEHG